MKKIVFSLLLVTTIVIVFILTITSFNEKKIVNEFKNQIIDKTTYNLDFSSIHFSLINSFPYGSFVLEDAYLFYSKESRKDTLLHSKKLYIKVNLFKLIQHIYEFPEIKATDATINIIADKIDQIFPNAKSNNEFYLIKTQKIRLTNSVLKYSYKESFRLKFSIKNSLCKASFSQKQLFVSFNLNVFNLESTANGFYYCLKGPILINTILTGNNIDYYCKNGSFNLNSIPLKFSFFYSKKSDDININIVGNKINAKGLSKELLTDKYINVVKGIISFDATYSINLKSSDFESQKLKINYRISDIHIKNAEYFAISSLSGQSSFRGNFKPNETDINDFSVNASGVKIEGAAKLKGLPNPYVLIDCKFSNTNNITKIDDDIIINGNFQGNMKSLIKLNNVINLNIKSLKIIKLNSSIFVKHISSPKYNFIRIDSGNFQLNENDLQFIGKVFLYKNIVSGSLEIPNFIEVLSKKTTPRVNFSFEMEKLNLDSLQLGTTNGSTSEFNADLNFIGKIKRIDYNGYSFRYNYFKMKYLKGELLCNNFSSNLFSGKASGNFSISKQREFKLFVVTQKLRIDDIFKCFNNFNQTYISFKNISGFLSGNTSLSFILDKKNAIDSHSIQLTSSFQIEKGTLQGVSQLNKISKYLNINELDTIKFRNLSNSIVINNDKVSIPKMDIASNAIDFTVSGEHFFSGDYTYWLKLNIRDVLAKKYGFNKKSTYESDGKGGINVFLTLSGNKETYKISLDKKRTLEHFKTSLQQEGIMLKALIKEEFQTNMKDSVSNINAKNKKYDSLHNKITKKPFRIEWEEIDSSKINNN